jgi:hypothetical protein
VATAQRSIRARRAAAQLLAAPGGPDAPSVVRRLLAVQAQDWRAARLALRARSDGLLAADVDRAMDARALAVGWPGRGTLHLVAADDYPWLLGLTAELARRYLAAHGPATAADLWAWIGLPLHDAHAGLRGIAGELVEDRGGLVDLARREAPPRRVAPRLLGAFDPYLLGWKDRAFAVPAEHGRRVRPGGGIVRAVATVDGLAVGTWSARRRGDGLAVEIERFAGVSARAQAALRREAADVARFEGRYGAPA